MSQKFVDPSGLNENVIKTKQHVEAVRSALDSAKQNVMQFTTLPVPDATWNGKVVQYTGTTTSSLTKGYFYSCEVVPDTDPTEYRWIRQDVMKPIDADGTTVAYDQVTGELSAIPATNSSKGIVQHGDGTEIGNDGQVNVVDRLVVTATLPTADDTLVGAVRLYVGASGTYELGGIYQCQETSTDVYEWVLISMADVDLSAYQKTFLGTTAEWNAKTTAQKIEYDEADLSDDLGGGMVVSTVPAQGDHNPIESQAVYNLGQELAKKLEKVVISDISEIPNNDIKDLVDGVYTIILGVITNPNLLNAPPVSSGVQLLITTASSGFRYFNCVPYNDGLPIYFGGLEPNGVIIGWRPVVVTSNRNLLDNPWFTVNQRGITSWSNEGVGYSADRWKHDGSATGNITNGVYTCNVPTYQTWEDDRITPLLGKTVTLSWILSDGSIGFETKTLPSALTSEYVWPFTNSYVVLALKSGNLSQVARITAGVAVKAVKLELGKVSTLAKDTAPNYATELLKCQRYFYRFKSYTTGISGFTGFSPYDGGIRFMIPLPVAMRIYPTITTSNVSDWGASQTNLTGAIPATTVKLDGRLGDNNMSVTFENSSYAVSKAYLMYAIASNAYMDFSADL